MMDEKIKEEIKVDASQNGMNLKKFCKGIICRLLFYAMHPKKLAIGAEAHISESGERKEKRK